MKLRDLILHNFRLKVFSFLIGVLIWETIHLSTKRRSAGPFSSTPVPTNQVER
jgi:hypothetical protein